MNLRRYFGSRPWPVIPFQPVCYLVMWGAALRLWIEPGTIEFDVVPGLPHNSFYDMWVGMGVVFPVLALLSWRMVTSHTGRARYLGMWLRLSADIGMFTVLTAYHAAMAFLSAAPQFAEGRLYSRYLTAAVMVQILAWIARDIYTLILVEGHARRIYRDA